MLKDYIARVKNKEGDILLVFILLLVAVVGFALGRVSALNEVKYKIQISNALLPNSGEPAGPSRMKFVGSKEGSVYHLLNCPGAKSIRESNKIYFDTQEDAQKAGYKPAANCPGL